MKKLTLILLIALISLSLAQPKKKVQWNDLQEAVKDSIRNASGAVLTADGVTIINSGGIISVDTTLIATQDFVNDSLAQLRLELADSVTQLRSDISDSLALHNYIVLELSASANVWNRTVARNSVTLTDAGADTLYFNLPTFRYLSSSFMIVDSIDFYIDSDNATTIDSVKIVANVAGSDLPIEENTGGSTPSSSYAITTVTFTPVGTGSILPKQIAIFLTVDTEIIFYALNVYCRIGEL